MYKLCKTEQSAARQRALEQGLMRAMLTRHYDEISIIDLCDSLNIPRKSFYRYFSGKDGALTALIDHTLMEFEQSGVNRVGPGGTPVADLERYFIYWYDHRDLLDALERSHLSGMLVERSMVHALHERLMPRYLRDMSREMQSMALTFAVSGLLAMVIQWHHEGFKQTPMAMAKVVTMMLTKPLVPEVKV